MWEKLLKDLSITSSTAISETLILHVITLDIYKNTTHTELKTEIEKYFINTYRQCNIESSKN